MTKSFGIIAAAPFTLGAIACASASPAPDRGDETIALPTADESATTTTTTTPTTGATATPAAKPTGPVPTFELTMSEWETDSEPNEDDPVGSSSATGTLSVAIVSPTGARRVERVADIDFGCHGAGCAATFRLDAHGAIIGAPDLNGLAMENLGDPLPRWGAYIPAHTVASLAVVEQAERAIFWYNIYHLVEADGDRYEVVRQSWTQGDAAPSAVGTETITSFAR